jgi:GH15 family glucan-1,4-alpha-glucosidase
MPYQPIENYGIIGNMRTVALVGMNGSLDWYCYPHFDSPSVFGAILDDKKGGRFQISVGSDRGASQTVLLAFLTDLRLRRNNTTRSGSMNLRVQRGNNKLTKIDIIKALGYTSN